MSDNGHEAGRSPASAEQARRDPCNDGSSNGGAGDGVRSVDPIGSDGGGGIDRGGSNGGRKISDGNNGGGINSGGIASDGSTISSSDGGSGSGSGSGGGEDGGGMTGDGMVSTVSDALPRQTETDTKSSPNPTSVLKLGDLSEIQVGFAALGDVASAALESEPLGEGIAAPSSSGKFRGRQDSPSSSESSPIPSPAYVSSTTAVTPIPSDSNKNSRIEITPQGPESDPLDAGQASAGAVFEGGIQAEREIGVPLRVGRRRRLPRAAAARMPASIPGRLLLDACCFLLGGFWWVAGGLVAALEAKIVWTPLGDEM